MAEIFKSKNKMLQVSSFKFQESGFVLISAVAIMSLLLLLVIYLVNFIITEFKISNSQATSVKTYYLAESAVAEAIWRIKNDPVWKNAFETNDAWSVVYTKNPALYPNSSYKIEIQNTGLARGEITATGYLTIGDKTAQRVVKSAVYKATGANPIGEAADYADGNIDMSGTVVNVYNGDVFSNGNIIVNFWSILNVDGDVNAGGNVNINHSSTVSANSINEGVTPINMPAVSFDDANDPNSYKNIADQIYTENEFEDLMWNNQNLTLNGITYVEGDVNVMGDQTLTINGLLVADGNVKLGKNSWFCCWGWGRCGRSDVVINQTASSSPSGILTKKRIDFEFCLDSFNGTGLLYANDKINILSLPNQINLTGGTISRKLTMTSLWQGINIYRDNGTIINSIGDPEFSPVVTVDHWEEEY